uniref:Uncharacterized protein n=1 Tax=Rhizophora mucronata TaxID=61149 RepID=A0A2P2QG79_RHIMU
MLNTTSPFSIAHDVFKAYGAVCVCE